MADADGREIRRVFSGRVVSADTNPRTAPVGFADGRQQREVFEIIMHDGTCPITVAAWGIKAKQLVEMVTENEQSDGSGPEQWLQIQICKVVSMRWALRSVCSINVINTIDAHDVVDEYGAEPDSVNMFAGSSFSLVPAAELPHPSLGAVNMESPEIMGLGAYHLLAEIAPLYRINLRGVAAEVGHAMPASSGQLMRSFKLVDSQGNFVRVNQLGSEALDGALVNGVRVIFYFLTVKKAWRDGEPGSVWAYENSYMHVEGPDPRTASCKKEIAIPSGEQ